MSEIHNIEKENIFLMSITVKVSTATFHSEISYVQICHPNILRTSLSRRKNICFLNFNRNGIKTKNKMIERSGLLSASDECKKIRHKD